MIALTEIEAARERLAGSIVRTPLVRLELDEAPAEIYLKLENLQPIGSFKLRGAGNALLLASPDGARARRVDRERGQHGAGRRLVGAQARRALHGRPSGHGSGDQDRGDPAAGRRDVPVTFDEWHEVFRTRTFEGLDGLHVHAFSDDAVMAGNGTIGLEIVEDLPDVDAVVAPYGGGGLSCGIASALRAVAPVLQGLRGRGGDGRSARRPRSKPVDPSRSSTRRASSTGSARRRSSRRCVELARELLAGSLVAELEEVEDAVRLLAGRARVVAEGAGATPLAVALSGAAGTGKVVCVVSGGNIDAATLAAILGG